MFKSSDKTGGGLPFGIPIPGSDTMSGASLDVIGGKFREAVAWLKSGREKGITPEDMMRFLEAAKAAQQGQLDRAIDELRHVGELSNLLERVAVKLHLRRKSKMFDPLLSILLTSRAVERANKAHEEFQRNHDSSVIDQLKSKAAMGRRLGRGGGCEACGSWMIAGEMRQAGGTSWKLCMDCIQLAQRIQEERRSALGDMASIFKKCGCDLQEAATLDPDSEHTRKNLEICNQILATIQV